jgi:hypothetical protein
MRTTLTLEDDVLSAARSLAEASGRSLGQVISELVRRGLEPRGSQIAEAGGLPVFSVPPGAPPITLETVRRALDDD